MFRLQFNICGYSTILHSQQHDGVLGIPKFIIFIVHISFLASLLSFHLSTSKNEFCGHQYGKYNLSNNVWKLALD